MKKNYFLLILSLLFGIHTTAFADKEDVTKNIKNPSFENGTNNWTVAGMQQQTNNSFTGKAGNVYLEKWVSKGNWAGDASVVQTIKNLPAGQYQLVVAAQNFQQDSSEKRAGAVIFAGENKTNVYLADDYAVEFTSLGDDIQIGFIAESATGNWIAVDNFRLYHLCVNMEALMRELAAAIADAEKVLELDMQPRFKTALQTAVDAAKGVTQDTEIETITSVAKDLSKARKEAAENHADFVQLTTYVQQASPLLDRPMSEAVKTELQSALAQATNIVSEGSDEDIKSVSARLSSAITTAKESNASYTALEEVITTAEGAYDESKTDAELLKAAIDAAKAVLALPESTSEQYDAEKKSLEAALLAFRVANGTGTKPSVKTGTVIQGSTVIFARATIGTASEKGLCWSSTNPEPEIYDNRSTVKYSNNGDIYAIEGLQPSTVYYVRPYAISSKYKVGYGTTVKVYTLPKGTVSGYYDNGGPDETTNQRIQKAFDEAMQIWNDVGSIQGFSPSVHYSAGTPTADCSYGGWIRMGASSSYQRTGTIMHEMLHGMGVINDEHGWNNATYRAGTTSGIWLGERVDRVVQFLENNADAHLNGDYQHMWPYGINGAHEDNGSHMLYCGNGLLIEALVEDGLISPGQNFAHPAYTFSQDDETKYYLKNENESYGLQTSYLREMPSNRIQWQPMMTEDLLANDSCAWFITFEPVSCTYTFKNAATGNTLVCAGTGNNGIRLSNKPTAANSRFQLLGARSFAKTKYGSTTFTFTSKGYWIVDATNHRALTGVAKNLTSATAFNHTNASSAQRWIIMTENDVTRFGTRVGDKAVSIRPVNMAVSEADVNVLAGKGRLTLTSAGKGQDVQVYSVDGRLVQQVYVQQNATATLRLPRGIYLVNGQKVLVK
ncbi:MAG: hypothetical protein J6W75_08085 [Bacteroidaceae bacterium]|nr:hypothetical protein [Bacteroidaceae bacterium]